ncbi:MAG TPA: peptidylprolyl isomerase, partial [Epsilonproteobacteria bacterium]|nr:peptidylprolyl isomerase [Campylobacterota bacterium]
MLRRSFLKGVLALCMGMSLLHAAESKAPVVVLETNVGKIELKLFPKAAPLAVENFVTHIKNGYYNGLIF